MAELPEDFLPETAAEAILVRLKQHDIDYLFANAGTDFAPVIEIYSKNQQSDLPIPTPIIAPHETAAVAMAHGYYLATGKPQAVMVHVNVGLANALMGIINAASDNIPIFLMAGRTPATEGARLGARSLPIHWGQDMRDQSAIVREFVKWEYELKLPEQATDLVDRGYAIAMSHPRGPVYLGLPREALGETWPDNVPFGPPRHAVSSPPAPDPDTVALIVDEIKVAKTPVIITQRGDPEGRLADALAVFSESFAIPVCEFWPSGNVLPTDHAMHLGFDPGQLLQDADLVIVLDALVPWLEAWAKPDPAAVIIQIGADPLFSRVPVRGFRSTINLTSDPAAAVIALDKAMSPPKGAFARDIAERHADMSNRSQARLKQTAQKAAIGEGGVMTAAFVSKTLSDCLPDDARVFSELGCDPSFMRFSAGNRYHSHALAGGLGWGMPAALGASLANRNQVTVACVGDGSYMFANPVACHQIAEANDLPLLTVVFNNGVWNAVRKTTLMMYPDGHASRANTVPMSSLAPIPDFTMVAAASRGWSRRVENGSELAAVIREAIEVVTGARRQALLEVVVSQN
ncbi:MAG: thiamine pyrophosphate-requiring protein [Anderseniella sp.]|nr:thiamine pyrophosphate-requiring protein [Anderseniella sp.]